MVDNEAADMGETVRTDLGARTDRHDVDSTLASESDDLLLRDSIEERQLGKPAGIPEPCFHVLPHILLQLIG